MTTADAAGMLRISQRQVQRMIAAGRLPATRTAGDAWVVDALAVNAMARARPDRGRPWSPAAAWAALWRLSGLEVDWLDRRTTSRLTARLESIGAEELLHATRRRAVVRRYRVSESFAAEFRTAVVLSGTSAMTAATFGIEADSTSLDGYCDSEALTRIVHDFHLVDDARGNATLRAAALRSLPIHGRKSMPVAVVAADLAESLEARERSAGLRVLEDLLRWRPCASRPHPAAGQHGLRAARSSR